MSLPLNYFTSEARAHAYYLLCYWFVSEVQEHRPVRCSYEATAARKSDLVMRQHGMTDRF